MANYKDGSHVCIVAKIPKEIADQFPTDGDVDVDVDDPHVTILYIGDMLKENVGSLINTCNDVFRSIPSFTARLASEPSYFDPTDSSDNKRVAKMDIECPELHKYHKVLWAELERNDVEVAHSFPDYHPHATLDYIEPDTVYDGPVPTGQWEVDAIEIWGFDEHIIIPFSAKSAKMVDAVVSRVIVDQVLNRHVNKGN